MAIDPEMNAFTGIDEQGVDLTPEVNDVWDDFFQAAQLAGIVGWQTTDKFTDETAKLTQAIKTRRQKSAPAPVVDDAHRLEKRYAGIHKGKKAHRVEKTAAGWTMEYDERGELIRGYSNEAA